jgi:L-lactate dehydrogenase complex protein LldG
MSARANILAAIKNNKPALQDLPSIELDQVIQYKDLVAQFKQVLQSIGGTAIELANIAALQSELADKKAANYYVVNTIEQLGAVETNLIHLTAQDLAGVDFAYLHGSLGVAENGAIWLYESQMGNRLLPFICQHLMILIHKKDIVNTMHQAYAQVQVAKEGFGVFIAGPSKTADIEQSLVIGAHGARSLVVYILD